MLKNYLLSLGVFVDNIYLDDYIKLLTNYTTTDSYTEAHHIIPVSFYITDYTVDRHTIEAIALADKHNKLINLSYSDHFYAHWLLYNCTLNRLKSSSAKTVLAMSGNNVDLLHYSIDEILEFKTTIKKDLSEYWSTDEDNYLISKFYTGFTKTDILAVANYLCKTPGAVRTRIARLKLSNRPWNSTDETWLRNNYKTLGKSACAVHLNRSKEAIEHKVTLLKISNRTWTPEQVTWLMTNYKLLPAATCAKYLGKSIDAVYYKASILKLKK